MSEPTATPSRRLVVKSTAGVAAPELTNQAFTVAATALAAGVDVSLWLTGDSTWLAVPGRAADLVLEHAPGLDDLLASVVEAGTVTVCTQCAVRRGITQDDLVAGVRIAGSAVFVEEIMAPQTQALVY